MTTSEEALEQGWLEPVPTFFGSDAIDHFRKCASSSWVVIRNTVPAPVLDTGSPAVRALAAESMTVGPELRSRLPHLHPRPRPFMYVPKAMFL